jgi:hypothetical protein
LSASVVAPTTADADNSWNTDGAQVGDDQSRLHPQLDRCCSEHLSTANNEATLPPHVDLPALYIEVVRPIDLQHHTPSITELPLGIEIAQPSVRVEALDLPIRLLNSEPPADSYEINFAQSL